MLSIDEITIGLLRNRLFDLYSYLEKIRLCIWKASLEINKSPFTMVGFHGDVLKPMDIRFETVNLIKNEYERLKRIEELFMCLEKESKKPLP